MAPPAGAKESRARRARADRALREARGGIERRAERCDDVPPLTSYEASRQAGCLTARDRRIERSARLVTVRTLDLEVAEQVTDAVRRVYDAPGADRERACEPRIRAGRRYRV